MYILKLENVGVAGTIGDNVLSVRLTRDVWQLEQHHVDLARAISAVARKYDAHPDHSAVQEIQVAIAATRHGSTVWMQKIDDSKTLRHAMHIDVSVASEEVLARLQAALDAGGRIVDDSHAPAYWTLADHAGNHVCIVA